MPTTFTRVGTPETAAVAGAATNINLIQVGGEGRYSLTAVRSASGNLRLINWRTDSEPVSRMGDSQGQGEERVSEIAITRTLGEEISGTSQRTVTAVRTSSGNLKLISWNDSGGQGAIRRLADTGDNGERVDLISIAPVTLQTVDLLTAVRTRGGGLQLNTWTLDRDSGAISSVGSGGTEDVRVNSIAVLEQRGLVVTAVQTERGLLRLISWMISDDGEQINQMGDSGNQELVNEIAMAGFARGPVTAVRTFGNNRLRLTRWRIDGRRIDRLDDSLADQTSMIAISRDRGFDSRYVTAVRQQGNLRLIAWESDTRKWRHRANGRQPNGRRQRSGWCRE